MKRGSVGLVLHGAVAEFDTFLNVFEFVELLRLLLVFSSNGIDGGFTTATEFCDCEGSGKSSSP